MFGVVIPETHLGHQEGLVEGFSRPIYGAKVLPIIVAAYLKPQAALATVEERLHGVRDGEGVPVALLDLQHLFYHQGAVTARYPIVCRKEYFGRQPGIPPRVPRGAGVDPQGRLEYLDTLATLLQKLEGETEASLLTVARPTCGSMTIQHRL